MVGLRYLILWLLLFMGSTTVFSTRYQKVFGSDWTSAARYVADHHAEWQQEFAPFGVDSRLAEAIVFPELIRYSMWQDEIERAAVNGLYVTKGSQGADFSIGRFQMKPSFAEQVEQAWNRSSLSKQYGFVFNLQPNNQARRSRIRRLSTMQGQCRYLGVEFYSKVTTYLHNQPDVFLHGFHVAFYFSTFLVLVTWVLGLFRLLGRKK